MSEKPEASHETSRPSFPARGDFGAQALVAPFEVDVVGMSGEAGLYGMRREAIYLWGTLRDTAGDLYTLMRRVPPDWRTARSRQLLLQSTRDGADALHFHPAGRTSAARVDSSSEVITADVATWRDDGTDEDAAFLAEYRADGCTWIEKGIVELRGKIVQPGMQWYLPGRDASMAYVATIFELEGTVLGRECTGFIGFDPVYLYEGGQLYGEKDPMLGQGLERLWFTWATRYDDGSLDAGHFVLGNDKFGFAIVTDQDQNVRTSTNVTGHFDLEDGYWAISAHVAFGDEQFEFLPDSRGRMPDFGRIPNPQIDGRWRPVGDTRKPVTWFSWGEVVPEHQEPRRRFTF
jgi:hypothetical protein